MKTSSEWLEVLVPERLKLKNCFSPKNYFQDALTEHRDNKIEKIDQECYIKDLTKDDSYLLSQNQTPVFAYIRRFPEGEIRTVHFTYCKIVQDMPKGKLYCTNDSSGNFEVDHEDKRGNKISSIKMELEPCEYCVGLYYGLSDYRFQEKRKQIKKKFDYSEAYWSLGKSLNQDAWVSRIYQMTDKSWSQLSLENRQRKNWTCEKCNLYLGEKYGRYLHVHHRNHDRNFNHDVNLECVCILCHEKYDNHESLKDLPEYKQLETLLEKGVLNL